MKRFRRNRKKAFTIGLSLLVLLSSLAAYLTFFAAKPAEAAWFDDSYHYRQYFSFTHNADISSERAITVSLDTAEFIAAGVMQADCDDTRFTDINGKLLRYQLTGTCNNAATTYEVVYPSIVNGPNPAYVYYGNPSAVSASENVSGVTALTPSGGDPAITTRTNEVKGPSPQMYLKFDEGVDNTCSGGTNDACDQTSNGNSGALGTSPANPTWQTEDLCLSGKCLRFDGTDDVVTVTNASSIDLDAQLAGAFTFQAWIRPNGAGEGTGGQIFYKGTNTWLRVDTLSSGKLDIEASLDLATTDATLNVSQAIDDNRWTHVALSYTDDADDEITIYVNGNNVGSSTNGVGAPAADTNNLLIGGTTTNNFKGFIDEFKIYKEERTQSQIYTDFQRGSASLHGASASFGVRDYSYLSDGLVGYWKMDDNVSGNAQSLVDSSGNAKTATTENNTTNLDCTVSGKFNRGCSLDGTDDYIFVSSPALPTTNFTYTGWIKPDITGNRTILMTSPNGASGNEINIELGVSNNLNVTINDTNLGTSVAVLTAGVWNHYAVTRSGNTVWFYVNGSFDKEATEGSLLDFGTCQLMIGVDADTLCSGSLARYFDGTMDELRIYRRALSSAEVSALYNWAPGPVGYWKLDENTGTSSTNDSSGNGNTGTMTSFSGDPWVPGKYGSALSFDSTDDLVNAGSAGILDDMPAFTAEAWVYPRTSGEGESGRIVLKAANGWLIRMNSTDRIVFNVNYDVTNLNASSSVAISRNTWTHIAVSWNGSATVSGNVKFYFNGVEVSQATPTNGDTNRLSDAAENLKIGNSSDQSNTFDGFIDDVRVYNYARTTSQIIEDMNAGHPAPGSPVGSYVARWKFDDMATTTAQDSSNNNNDLTLSSATAWTSAGKFGGAFDGADNRRASITNDPDLEPAANEDFAISLWVKSDSATNPGGNEYLVNMVNTGTGTAGYRMFFNSLGQIACEIDDDATFFPEDAAQTTTDYYDAAWHHVVCVRDITADKLFLYIDGLLAARDSDLSATGAIANSETFYVADQNATDGSDEFLGDIDELKFFRSALTAEEVKLDMNFGSSATLGDVDDHDNEGFAGNPPVGWWKLDENTGTSTVNDSSGNDNSLTMGNFASSAWEPGKYGSSLDFDGTNDTLSRADDADFDFGTGSFTVMAWIRHGTQTSGTDAILSKFESIGADGGYALWMEADGDLTFGIDDDSTAFTDTATSTAATYDDNNWHHVVGVKNGTTNIQLYIDGILITTTTVTETGTLDNNDILYVGTDFALSNWLGQLDDIRIYNYALTQAQIVYVFNRGQPLVYYKLDECSGTTANNSAPAASGGDSGIDATITIGATGSNTSAGTCGGAAGQAWFEGATGKRNASLDFDGTDDYARASANSAFQITGDVSFGAWFKAGTIGDVEAVIYAGGGPGETEAENELYMLRWDTTSGNDLEYKHENGLGVNTIIVFDTNLSTGTWYHAMIVRDVTANEVKLYVDGLQRGGTQTYTNDPTGGTSATLDIGAETLTNFFDGQIDDARVYNYQLTSDQVRRVYNQGAIFFGPATGSP